MVMLLAPEEDPARERAARRASSGGTRARLGRRSPAARRRAPSLGLRPRLPARRRRLRDAPGARRTHRPSSPSTPPACTARPTAWRSSCRTTSRGVSPTAIAQLLAAEGLDGPDGDASVRITVSRGDQPPTRPAAGEPARGDHRGPGVGRRAAAGGPPRAGPARHRQRRPARPGEPPGRPSRRPAGPTTSTPAWRPAGPGADDALFLTTGRHLSEATTANLFLVRVGELATPAARLRDPAGHDPRLAAPAGPRRPACTRTRRCSPRATCPRPTRPSCPAASRASCP